MIEFLKNVWALAKPYQARLFLGVLAGVLCGLMEPLMVATVVFVYNLIFPSAHSELQGSWRGAPEFLKNFLALVRHSGLAVLKSHPVAFIFVIAAIPTVVFLRGLFSYLNIYFLQWSAVRAVTDLRVRLFDHLIGLSAGFFDRNQSGELLSRVLNDTGALQTILGNITAVAVKDPITVASLMAYLFWQQPRLTLVSIVVLPLSMAPIVVYSRKVRKSSRAIQAHFADLARVMAESFTGNRIIKAYNLEATVAEQFREAASKFISHYMRIVRSSELPGPMLEFVGAFGVSLVFLYLIFQTGARSSSADFLKIILAILSMYRPLKNLTRLHSNLEQARAASGRVFELLATHERIAEPAFPKPIQAGGAAIEFDSVEFSYGEKEVLRGIDLRAQPGQLIALVGPSGSGKTTLTNLLLRFYDPTGGAIRVGGVDLRQAALRDLRAQIAVVTQEAFLFNDTIAKNIGIGCPVATSRQIIEAAKHAHAYEFIMEKPKGFEAIIGEKGVMLSGGQRQRIAIARAILKNAPILILDEATSALDSESERAVQSALEELMRGRTTFCIAHRLSTVQKADLIVVLDQGRIVEEGKHAELVRRRGVYQKLYEMQFQSDPAPALA